jgi:hypothetical protein
VVRWAAARGFVCRDLGSLYSGCWGIHKVDVEVMGSPVIFILGLLVFTLFVLGVFFNRREAKNSTSSKIETDTIDYDGSGNFGRIPNKKPKNRAI